ncbi:putative peptidoglycan binding protein [Luteibacter rhizovicinus]|uniref:Putative peptidoglycan binding protein n=1 Tax=Luteibacter rhizovicinus TaxID=242606 RepID=A0A4R3YX75_9GAMM|nr:peptidoglycan-binding domain-containing protein [Luteibacter rhizovicinus]TCV97220.1 putative peptidoglycan binding protein [Luteibacter rhizovicinus]
MDDVLSDKKITRLVKAEGKTRIYEMDDGSHLQATNGTVAWRNNNPGNLKFEHANSADTTIHSSRSRERALEEAQSRYQGIVDLDQWGNAVFESHEAGRNAQLKLLVDGMGGKTVAEMVKSYSTADYSGSAHHDAQLRTIYAEGDRQGVNLRDIVIKNMSDEEKSALADGVSQAEGWKKGDIAPISSQLAEQHAAQDATHQQTDQQSVHVTIADNVLKQGAHGAAVHELQNRLSELGHKDANGHHLAADGIAGPTTLNALHEMQQQRDATVAAPRLDHPTHPDYPLFQQARDGVHRLDAEHCRAPNQHSDNLAGALTVAARGAGMHRVDHVLLSDDASKTFAVQGDMQSPFKQYADVGTVQGMDTPLVQSSAIWNQQTQAPAQTQQQHQFHAQSPGLMPEQQASGMQR